MLGNDVVSSLSEKELNVFRYFQQKNHEKQLFNIILKYLVKVDELKFEDIRDICDHGEILNFQIINKKDPIKLTLTYGFGKFFNFELTIPQSDFDNFARIGRYIELPRRSKFSIKRQELVSDARSEEEENAIRPPVKILKF